MKKRSGIAPLIAIGGILLALSVGSFFLTPDRAFSENENRYLQLTPRLTWDRIMSGDFMEDVEDYTSDQIVFRDFWTASRSVLQRAEGKEDISGTYLGADGRYFAKVTDDSFDWVRLEKNAGYIRDFFAASGKPCTALIVPSPAGILRDMLPRTRRISTRTRPSASWAIFWAVRCWTAGKRYRRWTIPTTTRTTTGPPWARRRPIHCGHRPRGTPPAAMS